VGSIAHQVKQPLTVITTCSSIIENLLRNPKIDVSKVQLNLDDRQYTLWAEYPECFLERHAIIGGVVQRRVENQQIHGSSGEGQAVELCLDRHDVSVVVHIRAEPILAVGLEINGGGAMPTLGQPVGQPAASGAKVENHSPSSEILLPGSEETIGQGAEARGTDRPIRRETARQIPEWQCAIVG